MCFVEASGSSLIVPSTPFVSASIPSTSCRTPKLLWSNDESDIFIQLLEFLPRPPSFDSSLKDDLAIPLHVDDYDVPSELMFLDFNFLPLLLLIIPFLQILMLL